MGGCEALFVNFNSMENVYLYLLLAELSCWQTDNLEVDYSCCQGDREYKSPWEADVIQEDHGLTIHHTEKHGSQKKKKERKCGRPTGVLHSSSETHHRGAPFLHNDAPYVVQSTSSTAAAMENISGDTKSDLIQACLPSSSPPPCTFEMQCYTVRMPEHNI